MPTMSKCPNSGAILFTPTDSDVEMTKMKEKQEELEETVKRLQKIIEDSVVTKKTVKK